MFLYGRIVKMGNPGSLKIDNKKIILITVTEVTSIELKKQLHHFLGDKVQIDSYYIGNMPENLESDLIVLSSRFIFHQVNQCVKDKGKILVSRRGIDYNSISLLVDRKPGSNALVVMDLYEDALGFCDVLREIGFSDIHFFPWVSGMEVPKQIDFAVTTSKRHFIPEHISDVINVGIRRIDFTTMIEILYRLELLDEKASLFSSRFANTLVNLYKNLFLVAEETTKVKEYMESILQLNHDGVIVTDQDGHVILFNRTAELITGFRAGDLVRESYFAHLPQLKLMESIKQNRRLEEMIPFGHSQVVVSCSPVYIKERAIGAVAVLKDISEIQRLEKVIQKQLKKSGHIAKYSFADIHGKSEEIQTTITIAQKLAMVDSSILITGESGVGKELFAQAIHNLSSRKNGPFVAANFSAFADTLIESELFGYEDGAFTGAKRGGKPGLFELAHGGTIFLDEIGDASPNIQSRLLRVLQEKEIMRVGDTKMRQVDVRIIAATNKDLVERIKKGLFREDLYYRLASLPLIIPPLRERKNDIGFLLDQFISSVNKTRKVPFQLELEARNALIEHSWHGNIRELKNTIEYLNAIVTSDCMLLEDLPGTLGVDKRKTPVPAEESHVDEVIAALMMKDRWMEYYLCLYEMKRSYHLGKGIGRRRLAGLLSGSSYPLTEQEVRSRLTELERLGCVTIQAGAAGTKLTPFGVELWKKWEESTINMRRNR
jgi:sigma-54 dependent transcriptional regulator, acetoin dehydrogenase operon transcriptional activator AcoR